ncbi:MAG: hypothetical protein KKI08_24225 [Armatimonadetes bacterium]|nr:hypothetical protein [Armatimonadota bacterium]
MRAPAQLAIVVIIFTFSATAGTPSAEFDESVRLRFVEGVMLEEWQEPRVSKLYGGPAPQLHPALLRYFRPGITVEDVELQDDEQSTKHSAAALACLDPFVATSDDGGWLRKVGCARRGDLLLWGILESGYDAAERRTEEYEGAWWVGVGLIRSRVEAKLFVDPLDSDLFPLGTPRWLLLEDLQKPRTAPRPVFLPTVMDAPVPSWRCVFRIVVQHTTGIDIAKQLIASQGGNSERKQRISPAELPSGSPPAAVADGYGAP